ncbi:MAG: class I SAM-dependent methyltransferase [Phycisphaeraceae bacterium JB051]
MTDNQDKVFSGGEGNAYFARNKHRDMMTKHDWPCHLLSEVAIEKPVESVLELGCMDGYRLERLRSVYPQARMVGIDASSEAIASGQQKYPNVELHAGVLADPPVQGQFDIVIVNFVFHWVDRQTLCQSIASVDGLLRDGGLLVLGDFDPNHKQKTPYHHRQDVELYTFKQDYANTFISLGIYHPLIRVSFDHDTHASTVYSTTGRSRAMCCVLEKSLTGLYQTN